MEAIFEIRYKFQKGLDCLKDSLDRDALSSCLTLELKSAGQHHTSNGQQ